MEIDRKWHEICIVKKRNVRNIERESSGCNRRLEDTKADFIDIDVQI
jgi:hypothetical protein